MGITIRKGIPTRCFSKNIPNLTLGIGGDRLEVGIHVNNEQVYSETLFPVTVSYTHLDVYKRQCLSIENPCDLEENLKVLKETYYAYKADYARYDSFTLENEGDKSEEDGASDDLKTLKDINNARSYISKNVDKLSALKKEALKDDATDAQTKAYQSLLSSMTQRVQTLVDNGQVMGEDLMNKLQETGINLPASQPTEENVNADE